MTYFCWYNKHIIVQLLFFIAPIISVLIALVHNTALYNTSIWYAIMDSWFGHFLGLSVLYQNHTQVEQVTNRCNDVITKGSAHFSVNTTMALHTYMVQALPALQFHHSSHAGSLAGAAGSHTVLVCVVSLGLPQASHLRHLSAGCGHFICQCTTCTRGSHAVTSLTPLLSEHRVLVWSVKAAGVAREVAAISGLQRGLNAQIRCVEV